MLYVGYVAYEWFGLGRRRLLVPLLEVDLESDAVWKAGDAAHFREEEPGGVEGTGWGDAFQRITEW